MWPVRRLLKFSFNIYLDIPKTHFLACIINVILRTHPSPASIQAEYLECSSSNLTTYILESATLLPRYTKLPFIKTASILSRVRHFIHKWHLLPVYEKLLYCIVVLGETRVSTTRNSMNKLNMECMKMIAETHKQSSPLRFCVSHWSTYSLLTNTSSRVAN